MVNYYFELNEETKKYLLKYRNDFCIDYLEDLAFYKDDEVKFYSCTHEGFNSIKLDYREMTNEEIIGFINDEYYQQDNKEIIENTNKIIGMEPGSKFTFKELSITDKNLMDKICLICEKLDLQLFSLDNKKHSWSTMNKDGNFEKVIELPASLCNIDNIIEKKR